MATAHKELVAIKNEFITDALPDSGAAFGRLLAFGVAASYVAGVARMKNRMPAMGRILPVAKDRGRPEAEVRLTDAKGGFRRLPAVQLRNTNDCF